MIHVHIRDDEHRPTLDLGRLTDTVAALRERPTSSSSSPPAARCTTRSTHRLKVLDAEPDSCSLTMGTTNFGDDVFLNPWPFVTELYQLTQEREVVPEFELFDLGHVPALHRLLDKYGLPYGGKVHVDFVMGVPGGMPGTAGRAGRRRRRAARRRDVVVGHRHRPLDACRWRSPALAKGGHLRVGMEDVLTLARGVPVEHNAQLVERAADLAEIAQRPAMSTDEARELLQVKAR